MKQHHNNKTGNSESWQVLFDSVIFSPPQCFAEFCWCVIQRYAMPIALIVSIICSSRQSKQRWTKGVASETGQRARTNREKKITEDYESILGSFHLMSCCHVLSQLVLRRRSNDDEEYFHPLCHQQSVQRREIQSESCLTAEKTLL